MEDNLKWPAQPVPDEGPRSAGLQQDSLSVLVESLNRLTLQLAQQSQLLMALVEQNDALIQSMADQEEAPMRDLAGRPLFGGQG